MAYLKIENVQKFYGDYSVLNNISFEAKKGEFVTLLGPSGCGKSTLLRAISGLSSLDSGNIILDGVDITHLAPKSRNISMVFQNYALFPNMSVFENVAFGLKMQKVSKQEIEQRVEAIVELVDLKKHLHKLPSQLSGGQCQRVALARSLVVKPKLLLLDEPLSALDAKIRRHLRAQIREIQRELNMTTLFVTHDQEEALTMSDEIIILNQGNIAQKGDPESIYLKPSSQFVAEFIGNYNLLTPDEFKVITDQNIKTHVAIRPESIVIGEAGILGIVQGYSMLGSVIRYQVNIEGVELYIDHLHRSEKDLFKVGSQLNVHLALDQVHYIPY